jgi:hypothetical protein
MSRSPNWPLTSALDGTDADSGDRASRTADRSSNLLTQSHWRLRNRLAIRNLAGVQAIRNFLARY